MPARRANSYVVSIGETQIFAVCNACDTPGRGVRDRAETAVQRLEEDDTEIESV